MPTKTPSSVCQLLRDYQQSRSEEAFRELVDRYIDFVYGIASRKCERTGVSIDDIVQTVFIDLGRKAPGLSAETPLGGWLHRHTHFVTAKFMRAERRRIERERIFLEMDTQQRDERATEFWHEISPLLDDALHQLRDRDRDAIVMRFFERLSLRHVGDALGVSEDAAQKRLTRALQRLRHLLHRRGLSLASTNVLATTLQSNAVTIKAPTGLVAQVASEAWASTTTSAATLTTPFLMISKAKATAFVSLTLLSAFVTIPFARQSGTSIAVTNLPRESMLPARSSGRAVDVFSRKRDRLRDLWSAEQLVNTDPERALQLCMDGESTDRALWENLLRYLLPNRVEDAMMLVARGRCFRSSDDRDRAIAFLIDQLPLNVLSTQIDAIANMRGPRVTSLLNAICEHWAASAPEEARQGVLALTNPLYRQHALAAVLAASLDAGSEAWTQAYEHLSPMLRTEAIEPIFATGRVEEQIAWINQYLFESHQWPEMMIRALRNTGSPREAIAHAEQNGLLDDDKLRWSLAEWAAQDDPSLYLRWFGEAVGDEQWRLLRNGLQGVLRNTPDDALRMIEENPQYIDPWSISVLSKGVTTPQQLQRLQALLDSSQKVKGHYMSFTNYLYAVARQDPDTFLAAWNTYSKGYSEDQRADNVRRMFPEMWRDPKRHAIAADWIANLSSADADGAYEGLARSALEYEEALSWVNKIDNRSDRNRVLTIIYKTHHE